jgi:hypothetical protein
MKTFAQWAKMFPKWKRVIEGEDTWPFGYTRDQDEAAKTAKITAMELFQSAEDKDINTGVYNEDADETFQTGDSVSDALQVAALGIGVTNIVDVQSGQGAHRLLASAQLATSQLAIFSSGKGKRLPCLFVIRAYRKDEAKAGLLSVRVFRHGRAPRAPLQEMCHFSLRFESLGDPRKSGE